jgi:hypothetical protein
LIENNINLIFFNVDGYLRKLWRFARMKIKRRIILNARMRRKMINILDGGGKKL